MQLPSLPQDKANHAFWGAVLASGLSVVSLQVAAAACLAAAILKELSDAWVNYKSTGNPRFGPHGVEFLDAVATTTGGALVLAPQYLITYLGGV